MGQLETVIKVLIAEGVLERDVTQVSRQVVNKLKARLARNKGFKKAFRFSVPAPDAIDVKSINVSVTKSNIVDIPVISGGFRSDPNALQKNVVEISIAAPRVWSDLDEAMKQMSEVVAELKDILRHEFEHSKQSAEDIFRISGYDLTDLQDLIRYILDPAEISAHVMGMYKNAKVRKADISDVFTERQGDVIHLAKRAGATEDEAQQVTQAALDAWRAFAVARLPKARL